MRIRERSEEREESVLSPRAAKSRHAVREREEEPDAMRTAFQRDRDRIIHSKSFRRLKHKTQVYIAPGDHYRTRMTHTLEVGQIARTAARALNLNEDLTEAIAMGHDVGHTPFGHVGEEVLARLTGHFRHNEQSVHILSHIERNGRGLNLTEEVRDGILGHTGTTPPKTLEGQIVRIADRIAYLCHDFDDAVRAGMLTVRDLPEEVQEVLGRTPSDMITTMVSDMVLTSEDKDEIAMSETVKRAMDRFRSFMFSEVYRAPAMMPDRERAAYVVEHIYRYYVDHPGRLPAEPYHDDANGVTTRDIVDYVAGLTDQYAIKLFKEFYLPSHREV